MEGLSDADMEAMIASECRQHVGKERIVRFLTSSTGLTLNEKRCTVLSLTGNGRVAVRMHHDGSEHALRPQNLLDPKFLPFGSYQHHSGPLIAEDELRRLLANAVRHESVTNCINSRKDIARRVAISQQYISGSPWPLTRCCDPHLPEQEQDPVTRLLQKVKPCCSGDGTVDLRRFNVGLVHHDEGDCSICMEALGLGQGAEEGRRSLGLPCGHAFHLGCCEKWLGSNDTCPQCRYDLGQPGREYLEMFRSYEARVDVRLREFLISGMCERCQAVIHESNPVVFVPTAIGPTIVSRRSVQ